MQVTYRSIAVLIVVTRYTWLLFPYVWAQSQASSFNGNRSLHPVDLELEVVLPDMGGRRFITAIGSPDASWYDLLQRQTDELVTITAPSISMSDDISRFTAAWHCFSTKKMHENATERQLKLNNFLQTTLWAMTNRTVWKYDDKRQRHEKNKICREISNNATAADHTRRKRLTSVDIAFSRQ